MSMFVTLLMAVVASSQATLTTQDGKQRSGILERWDDDRLEFRSADGTVEQLVPDQVQRIDFRQDTSAASRAPRVRVTLADGSELGADEFEMEGGAARVRSAAGKQLEIPGGQIHSVLWKPLDQTSRAQWNEIVQQRRDSDVAVIARSAGALDYVSGVLGGVTSEQVKFEFNDRWVDLPRERLAGVVLASSSRQFPRPRYRITWRDGRVWNLEKIAIDRGVVRGESQVGVSLEATLDGVGQIDLLAAAFTYLSDMSPLRSAWTPYVELALVDASWFEPRQDAALWGGPLVLRVSEEPAEWRTFAKGLSLYSRSELEYRLGGKYRSLTAWVGLDPRAAEPGHVEIRVFADRQLIWEKALAGGEVAERLELNVTGAERLRIVVDYGDRHDVGDYVNLCDTRLWE